MNKRIIILMAFVVFGVTMVGAPVAGANPVSAQYDAPSTTPPVTQIKGEKSDTKTASKTAPKTATESSPVAAVPASGTLPFTGLNLGLFLVIGGAAVTSGLALRRIAARRPEDS